MDIKHIRPREKEDQQTLPKKIAPGRRVGQLQRGGQQRGEPFWLASGVVRGVLRLLSSATASNVRQEAPVALKVLPLLGGDSLRENRVIDHLLSMRQLGEELAEQRDRTVFELVALKDVLREEELRGNEEELSTFLEEMRDVLLEPFFGRGAPPDEPPAATAPGEPPVETTTPSFLTDASPELKQKVGEMVLELPTRLLKTKTTLGGGVLAPIPRQMVVESARPCSVAESERGPRLLLASVEELLKKILEEVTHYRRFRRVLPDAGAYQIPPDPVQGEWRHPYHYLHLYSRDARLMMSDADRRNAVGGGGTRTTVEPGLTSTALERALRVLRMWWKPPI